MRFLYWIPLATILGLSISLAVLLSRPQAPTIVIMVVAAAPAPAAVVHVLPAFCHGWTARYSSVDLRPWCW